MCAAPSGFFPALAAASEGNPVSQKQEPKLSNNNSNCQGDSNCQSNSNNNNNNRCCRSIAQAPHLPTSIGTTAKRAANAVKDTSTPSESLVTRKAGRAAAVLPKRNAAQLRMTAVVRFANNRSPDRDVPQIEDGEKEADERLFPIPHSRVPIPSPTDQTPATTDRDPNCATGRADRARDSHRCRAGPH